MKEESQPSHQKNQGAILSTTWQRSLNTRAATGSGMQHMGCFLQLWFTPHPATPWLSAITRNPFSTSLQAEQHRQARHVSLVQFHQERASHAGVRTVTAAVQPVAQRLRLRWDTEPRNKLSQCSTGTTRPGASSSVTLLTSMIS